MRHRETKIFKSQLLRQEIRTRQKNQMFSLNRHSLPELSNTDLQALHGKNLKQLQTILSRCPFHSLLPEAPTLRFPYTPINININNNNQLHPYSGDGTGWGEQIGECKCDRYRVQVLLKELRDMCCSMEMGCQWGSAHCVGVFVAIQARNVLDRQSMQFVYQILLNLSAMIPLQKKCPKCSHPHTSLSPPQVPPTQTLEPLLLVPNPSPYLVQLTLQTLSNMLQKDQTSQTLYNYITKYKLLKLLLKLLIENLSIKFTIYRTLLWFVNKIVSRILRFGFQNVDGDWGNLVNVFVGEVIRLVQNRQFVDRGEDILVALKTVLKVDPEQVTDHVIRQMQAYFSATNPYYTDYLSTLICKTTYSIPQPHLHQTLTQVLTNPLSTLTSHHLRNISNSLINDSTNWRTVLDTFIRYSNIENPPPSIIQPHSYQLFEQIKNFVPCFLLYFVYFLSRNDTQSQMADIVGVIVCGQGGLGVFQDGVEYLVQFQPFKNKLISFGYEIQ